MIMNIDDIFSDLQYGELSKHGMFADTLSENDKERLITHINIALTALYTRFPLLTRELTLVQIGGRTAYVLSKEHAVTNTTDVGYDKYIIDTPTAPFNNDLVKIVEVYDELGNEIAMNDWTACPVVVTPAYNIIEIPQVVDTNALFVIYQAKHPVVSLQNKEIHLPEQFRPALLAYIAHRVYSGGTAQEHINLSNMMLQKYELVCAQNREYGTDNSYDGDKNIRPCLGGWV